MYESSLYNAKTYVYADSDNVDTLVYNILYGEKEYGAIFEKALNSNETVSKLNIFTCIHPKTRKNIPKLILNMN